VSSTWPEVPLADACTLITDGTHHSPPNFSTGDFKYVTAKNIRRWGLDVSDVTYVDSRTHDAIYKRCPVEYGDVLYIKDGVTTGLAVVNSLAEPFSMLSSVALLKPKRDLLSPRYLKHWLNSPETFAMMTSQMTGSAIKRLVLKQIRAATIPLPSVAEQERIADKLDRLLAAVDTCKSRLDAIPAILKRFRQSVLAAACSGRLTDEWRQGRSFSESAESFLQKLLTQREQVWIRSSGMNYRRPNEPDRAELPNHPDSWVIASMDELTTRITSGSRDWSKYYGSGAGTFLMAQNVRPGRLDLSFRQTVDPPANDRDRLRSQVNKGDLLVTIVGANTGDVCPVTDELKDHYVCQSVALMRPIEADLCSFLNLWLNSSAHGRKQYQRYIYGEGRPHLSFDQLRMTPVAVPPPEEQQEIVRRVQSLLNQADRLEMKVSAARACVDESTQGLLAKAFCGELDVKARSTKQQSNRFEVVANWDQSL
jgi:type I restriction enzyme, S subunit